MKCVNGPLDGADLPERVGFYAMIVTYHNGDDAEVLNFVYMQSEKAWVFEAEITREGRKLVSEIEPPSPAPTEQKP